jgi:hypothetical protein
MNKIKIEKKDMITKCKKKNGKARCGAHACNPNYTGGGDGEDLSPRPAWAKS